MSGDAVGLLKEHLTLSSVIGRYCDLKKRGTRLVACCPFHGEKTPSFYVDDNKGFFHCFGCGKGGDLLTFAQEIEGVSFVEALDFLADIAGIELPKRGRRGPSRDTVEAIRAINDDTVTFFEQQLAHHQGAKDYLARRGITQNTAKLFKLGWAPDSFDALFEQLKPHHDPRMLELCGLFKLNKNGKPYSLFRGRLIFPIRDVYGHTIAFGGRLIGDEEGPKYINSPETPVYTKGKHVYNLDFAKVYLKKRPEIVVTEGYMDAIQLYQAGIGGVIAGLGTAFTPEQARLLNRLADKVYLNFDADAAGFKAARASIETFLTLDMEIGVISLPDKQDPDDFIRANGVDAYRAQIEQAVGFYDFLMGYLADDADLDNDPRMRSVVAREMAGTLQKIDDPVVSRFWMEKLSEDLGIPAQVMSQVFAEQEVARPRAPDPEPTRVRIAENPFNQIEREFLFHVMHRADFSADFTDEHRAMLDKMLHTIFSDRPWVLELITSGHKEALEETLEVVPPEYQPHLRGIYLDEAYESEDATRLEILFPDLLSQMLENVAQRNKQRIRLLPPEEMAQKQALMKKNAQLSKQIHNLRQMTG